MRHASEQRALLRRQGEVSEQRPPYASIGAMQFYKQRALPSQAGRSRRAAHPTRVGVMQASEQRAISAASALPLQAGRDKRAAPPYARVGV